MANTRPGSAKGQARPSPRGLHHAARYGYAPFMVMIVTGGRGAGKTRFCEEAFEAARGAGLLAAGIVSPADRPEGEAVSYEVLDLSSGQRILLCSSIKLLGGPSCGRFSFSAEAFAWAVGRFRAAPATGSPTFAVLDEIGPLELGWPSGEARGPSLPGGGGFGPLLPLLAAFPGIAIATTRPALVPTLSALLRPAAILDLGAGTPASIGLAPSWLAEVWNRARARAILS